MSAPATLQPQAPQACATILHKLLLAGRQILIVIHSRIPTQSKAPLKQAIQNVVIFDTIARCMRRCILIAQRLAHPPRPRASSQPAPPRADPVETRETADSTAPERGESPIRAERLPNRPIPELIAGIYRTLARVAARMDLPPELLRTLEDLKTLCIPAQPQPPRQPPHVPFPDLTPDLTHPQTRTAPTAPPSG